jgi:putative ABC transport system permease protein
MLLNYLKLSFRLLVRNPFITGINVVGLSVGFTAFYILWPYTKSELISDQFHSDHEQIARLSWHHRWTDNNQDWDEFYHALNFCGIGKHITEEFSEVKELTRLIPQKYFVKKHQGLNSKIFMAVYKSDSTKELFQEENTAFADPNFFQFFSFPIQSGDAATVLAQPRSVVISQQQSRKYFGDTDPINSIIYLNDSMPLKVTGVFKNLPRNTHFKFDALISTAGFDDIDLRFDPNSEANWMGANYIKVNQGVRFADLQRKIDAQRKILYAHWKNCDPSVFVQPLKDIVFHDLVDNPFIHKSKNGLIILHVLSIAILFLAWTNYISFSITTLHRRLPELGTRKVVGARNRDFFIQFFVEAAIISFFSILLALTLIQLLKAPAEYLFHFYTVDWQTTMDQHLIMLLLIPILGILVIGFYPVLIASRKPAADLLKKLRSVQMPWWIRAMVTFQYASEVVLLVWIGAVYFQINFILSKNTGVNPVGILVVDCPIVRKGTHNNKLDYFINESRKLRGIVQASLSKSVMGDHAGIPFFAKRNKDGIELGLLSNGVVDEHFLDLYGIPLLEGRNFQPDHPGDRNSVLLSRVAVERLGFSSPKECIGARIVLPVYNTTDVEIIGVYEEYEFLPYFAEAQQRGQGSILTYKNSIAADIAPSKISFKINWEVAGSTIGKLEELYRTTFPLDTFRWVFLDQNINRHYAQEQVIRNQIMLFTLLAIGIACLGLLGTTTNKAMEKTKEIGIRKVLGARLHQIAQLILNTTLRQVIIANMVGIPAAYYLIEKYLERYSEHLSFQWWHYAFPVLILILIMFSTIAPVIWKAAKNNPVEALKHE